MSGAPERTPAFTALVMAGSRPTGDPLARAAGVAHKALAPVAGRPMLAHVLDALHAATAVRRVVICGLPPELARGEPALRAIDAARPLEMIAGGATPGASVGVAIDTLALAPPLLITTADHPLLTAAMVDEFCAASAALAGADVSFGLAPGERVAALFPGIRRTHYRFRDGAFCGCNLYGLLTPAGCTAPAAWMRVEQGRKRPWRMVGALGPRVLIRFLLGRLTLDEVTALIRRRIGLWARPVHLSDPAAGFDVDTVEQQRAAEDYLRQALRP